MTGLDEESSQEPYQQIKASELYPKKPLKADDTGTQVPFPELCGESAEYLGKTTDGLIALSNYRLFVRFKSSFVNVPLGLIESVEYRDIFFIYVCCKDAHSFRCTFSTNEVCLEWYKRLCVAITPPAKVSEVFAFPFNAYLRDHMGEVKEPGHPLSRMVVDAPELEVGSHTSVVESASVRGKWYSFDKEVERMGLIDRKNQVWKITHINEQFKVCRSYPKLHIVPKTVSDTEIETVAGFRASRRFPSVVWRDRRSGAVIARCSQPEVGWLGWRNNQDEALIEAIASACLESTPPTPCPETVTNRKMLILDARSYAAAVANRAKGGGCECIEYYPQCEIQFMSLANIHTVRKSFQALRSLCSAGGDQPGWLQGIETTKWLNHMSSLMRAAVTVVSAIDKEWRPVLVHCSDGWDRTPQIVALSEILLDPYYRTFEGFRVLVEREWLQFGHKFGDRCGVGQCSDDTNERCPVFLQFLDCVHQLLLQYPLAFHFNEAYLVKLVHHTYSNLYGTFLCNNVHDRLVNKVPEQTSSVWSLLSSRAKQFINPLYIPHEQALEISWCVKDLYLWRKVYMHKSSPSGFEESDSNEKLPGSDGNPDKEPLPKTRSCENLVALGNTEHTLTSSGRRLSDPNIKMNSSSLAGSYPTETVTKDEVLPEGSLKGVVINKDCVTYSKDSKDSESTLVAENSSSSNMVGEVKVTETGEESLENSIININHLEEEDRVNRICEEDREGINGVLNIEKPDKATMTTIPSQDSLEGCDKSPQCSKTDDKSTSSAQIPLVNGNEDCIHGQQQQEVEKQEAESDQSSQRHVNGISVAKEGEVVVRQPGSAVFSQDPSERVTSINGSASDPTQATSAAALLSIRSQQPQTPASVVSSCHDDHQDNRTDQQEAEAESLLSNGGCCSPKSSPGCEEAESRDSFPGQLPKKMAEVGVNGQNNKASLIQAKASNMSTSTSDISDSHVHIDFKSKLTGKPSAVKVDETLLGLDMSTVTLEKKHKAQKHHLQVDLALCNGHTSQAAAAAGPLPTMNGHGNNRCPDHSPAVSPSEGSRHTSAAASSTGTPSPASEKSWWSTSRPQNGVSRHLDVDGLQRFEDPVQTRMMEIIGCYQDHVRLLEGKLQTAKSLLYHYTSGKNGAAGKPSLEEYLSGDDETEHSSLGGRSGASDASYELVGEEDALMTLWVPDHAVTHCTGCDVEFWIVRRKHHCRNCGKVFCGSCAPHYTPVPQQQLTDPVRVCRCCFSRIHHNPIESCSPDKEAQLGNAMEEEVEEASCLATAVA